MNIAYAIWIQIIQMKKMKCNAGFAVLNLQTEYMLLKLGKGKYIYMYWKFAANVHNIIKYLVKYLIACKVH